MDILSRVDRAILGKESFGLEYVICPEGRVSIFIVKSVLRDSNVEVEFVQEFTSISKVKSICKNSPVSLCVSGAGIITKKMSNGEDMTQVFPGLDETSTLVKDYGSEECNWKVLAKKQMIDDIVLEFKRLGIKIVRVDLSGVSIFGQIQLLNELPLILGPHRFVWEENNLKEYDIELNIDNPESVETAFGQPLRFLVAIFSALHFFGQGNSIEIIQHKDLLGEYVLGRMRQVMFIAFSIVAVVLLVFNFIFLTQFNSKISELESAVEVKSNAIKLVERESIEAEESALLYNDLVAKKKHFSNMLQDIARCVPDEIKLTGIEIFPKESKAPVKGELKFDKSALRIVGYTSGIEHLNALQGELNALDWVSETQLVQFEKDFVGSNTKFIIQLIV